MPLLYTYCEKRLSPHQKKKKKYFNLLEESMTKAVNIRVMFKGYSFESYEKYFDVSPHKYIDFSTPKNEKVA